MKNTTSLMHRYAMLLFLWAFAHLAIWSLIPFLCNTCLPLDSIEASMWGSQWAWGYDKHPPLSGWTAYASSLIAGDLGVYFLAQLCVVSAGLGIYRLARLLGLDSKAAFLSVLALDLIFYYQYAAVEYNVNVLQMPFWAWGWFFGIDAVKNKRFASWIGLGCCIALGALTKYIAVFLLVPLFVAWWRRGELKQALSSPGLYIAGIVSILLFLPHLVWMKNHDWITITYGLSRGGEEHFWWHNLWHPLEFLLGQAAILAPVIIVALFCRKKYKPTPQNIPGSAALAFGAFGFIALIALVSGMAPVTMWAAPMPLALGIWLVSRYRLADHPRPLMLMVSITSIFLVVAYIVVYGLAPVLRGKPHRVNYPGKAMAEQVERIWNENSNEPFSYIIGDEWYGGIVNHYGKEKPAVVIHGDFRLSTYLTEADVRKEGALVFWKKSSNQRSEKQKTMEREFPELTTQFKQIKELPDLIIPWPRRTDGKAGRYGVAYIPPNSNQQRETTKDWQNNLETE